MLIGTASKCTKTNAGGDVTTSKSGNYYTFTMPDSDVTLTVTFKSTSPSTTTYNITTNTSTNGTYTVSTTTNITSGTTIYVTPTAVEGYEVDTVLCTKTDTGEEVTTSQSGSYYTFTMPATDTTLTVTFKEKSGYTVEYKEQDGSVAIATKTDVKWTDTVVSASDMLTKSGYTFVGWCTDTELKTTAFKTGTKYSDLVSSDTVTSVTLYAKWQKTGSGGDEPTPSQKEAKTEKDLQDKISKGGDVELKNNLELKNKLDVEKKSEINGNDKVLKTDKGLDVHKNGDLSLKKVTINPGENLSEPVLNVQSGGKVAIENTVIEGSKSDNGAVSVESGGTMVIKSGSRIYGNTRRDGKFPRNVYLKKGAVLDISFLKKEDSKTTKIGISTEELPTEGHPVIIGIVNSEDVSACFVSDDDRYEIIDYTPDLQTNADEVVHYVALALKADEPKFTGWQQTDGKWQYYKDGKFLTDWHNDVPGWEGQWFYFDNTTGYAKSTWANYIHGWEGQWFYFNPNTCVMMKNWVNDGGTRFFYLDDNTGVMKTGWHFLNWSGGANWFYFDNNGSCLTNTTTPDGYYVDGNGAWVQ